MINVAFGEICIEIGALDEAKEELVDNLQVRPSKLEHRFIFFWVERVTCRIHRWGYRTE